MEASSTPAYIMLYTIEPEELLDKHSNEPYEGLLACNKFAECMRSSCNGSIATI